MLSTPLPRLARIMLSLILGLLALIARQPRNGTAHCPRDPVRRARGIVVDLSLGLLFLALEVLLAARLLEILCHHHRQPLQCRKRGKGETYLTPNNPAQRLLGRANRLVPRAGGAVRVVARHAGGRGRRAGELDSRVRRVVLGLRLVLLGLALSLVARGAEEGADGVLDGTGGRVDVGLEGGGVVRHGDCYGGVSLVWFCCLCCVVMC